MTDYEIRVIKHILPTYEGPMTDWYVMIGETAIFCTSEAQAIKIKNTVDTLLDHVRASAEQAGNKEGYEQGYRDGLHASEK